MSGGRIERIEITHHQLDLDPPFLAAWDTQPRRKFPATIVRVYDDQGRMGVGSGDAMYGFADYQHLFLGQDSTDLSRHSAVLDNISFHAGRPWPLDVALWDLAGQAMQQPCWRLLGGKSRRLRAYASSGSEHTPHALARLAEHLVERGFPALKVRLKRGPLTDTLALLAAVRAAVGDKLALAVDCNQGWRMPWDTAPAWSVGQAIEVAQALEPYNIMWLEEPLHRGDYEGYQILRKRALMRIAGGEMTRELHEFRALLANDCLDIYQPDVVCSLGMEGLRKLAGEIAAHGKVFTPHTWGNGIGLWANVHLTAGTSEVTPLIEFPYDPPTWSLERRDFMLQSPIDIDKEGWLVLSDQPGLGLKLDEDQLAHTQAALSTYT